MASVDFHKCKGATSAKGVIRHCDPEKRKENNHSNQHIDKSLTDSNFSARFKINGESREVSYEETCERYDRRIAYLDSHGNKNKRSDRVTCFSLCIPTPDNLKQGDTKAFFAEVSRITREKYGDVNFINAYIHLDEEHDYKDAETGLERTSRPHGHFLFVPECDGQLNGKWFSSRANMKDLNRRIDEMAREKFGVKFMDGSQKKSRKSVEQLKNESAEVELKQLNEKISQAKVELSTITEEYDRKSTDLNNIQDQLFDYELNGNYQLIKENKILKEENTRLRETNNRLMKFIQDLFENRDFGKTIKDKFNMRFGKSVKKSEQTLSRD